LLVLPGMSVDVAIDLSQIRKASADHLQVPVEAVFKQDGKEGAFVWRYQAQDQEGTVTAVPVMLGQVVGDGVEILDGLQAGDRVVSAGVHHLEEGQTVRELVKERGL